MKPVICFLAIMIVGFESSGGRTSVDMAMPIDLARAGDFASKPLPMFDLYGLPDLNLIYAHTKDTLFTVNPTTFARPSCMAGVVDMGSRRRSFAKPDRAKKATYVSPQTQPIAVKPANRVYGNNGEFNSVHGS